MNEENTKSQIWQKIHVDLPLLFAIIALIAFSMVVLYSASGQHADMLFNKLVHTALAFSVMLVMAQFSPAFMPAGHHRLFWYASYYCCVS